ncbi:MAG: hypothetical protein H0W74_05530 [Sphingosinicella sp.]|nr:hypothetical protein [Sphingosinicella sp.]
MNNRGIMVVTSIFAAMLAEGASAQTRGGFEVGAEVFDYNYRERQDGQVVAKDDGIFGGASVGYIETVGGGAFLRARLNIAFGSVDYSSSGPILEDPEIGEARLDNVPQSIGQLELHIGKDFMLSNGASITPFIGIGSRYLSDKSGGRETADGLAGYDREISYAYVPLGIAAGVPLGGRAILNLSAQYNWLAGGDSKSHFSAISRELPDVEVEFKDGHGYDASAMIGVPVGSKRIAFGPFFRSWKIDQSQSFILTNPEDPTESIELFEPKNRTTEVGFRLSLAF